MKSCSEVKPSSARDGRPFPGINSGYEADAVPVMDTRATNILGGVILTIFVTGV